MQFLQVNLESKDNLSEIDAAIYICFPFAIISTILIYLFIGLCFGDLPWIPFKGRTNSQKKHIRKINADIALLDISGWDFFEDDRGDGS
uniref:Uncharacterized protein n=1 Tax=Panagrolaimus sp. ES5 TaxID=591445 RepID=A0AC34GE77_9BILA